MGEPVNPFSTPCLLVSSLTISAVTAIIWSSYGMGLNSENRGGQGYITGASFVMLGMCLLGLAVGIIKFVD